MKQEENKESFLPAFLVKRYRLTGKPTPPFEHIPSPHCSLSKKHYEKKHFIDNGMDACLCAGKLAAGGCLYGHHLEEQGWNHHCGTYH